MLKTTPSGVNPVFYRRGAANRSADPCPDPQPGLEAEIARLKSELLKQARADYDSGFQAGQLAARKALESEMQSAVQRLAATIAEVASTRAETIRRAEADTVRLAMEIARRVLHRELTTDPHALEALARAALEKLQSQEILRVRLHPELEPTVRRCLEASGRGPAVDILADPSQPRGGAVFDTARGTLDASVETQLQEIERGLADQLGGTL